MIDENTQKLIEWKSADIKQCIYILWSKGRMASTEELRVAYKAVDQLVDILLSVKDDTE